MMKTDTTITCDTFFKNFMAAENMNSLKQSTKEKQMMGSLNNVQSFFDPIVIKAVKSESLNHHQITR